MGMEKATDGNFLQQVVGFPMRSGITSGKEFGSVFEGTPYWAEVANGDIDE
jgi:hypothetical protein